MDPQLALPCPTTTFRTELLRAAFGPEPPPEETHRRIVGWARAAAPNTVRAMLSDLRIVDAYQAARDRPALPIKPMDLYLLLHERAAAGARKSSIDRLVASAVRLHDLAGFASPVDDAVRWKQKEIRKADTAPVRQAHGLRLKGATADVLTDPPQPLSILRLLEFIPGDPAGLRDRALISIGYDAGLRRSELVRIRVEHVEPLPSGEGSLFLPRSKTDSEGEGARVWLSGRSMKHLDLWLAKSDLQSGFIFRPLSYRVGVHGHLAEGAVTRIVKRRVSDLLESLVASGQLDANESQRLARAVSSHSLRVGCDQDLLAAGVDIGAIMQGLRWRSPKQPLAYARHLAPASSKLAAMMRQVQYDRDPQ